MIKSVFPHQISGKSKISLAWCTHLLHRVLVVQNIPEEGRFRVCLVCLAHCHEEAHSLTRNHEKKENPGLNSDNNCMRFNSVGGTVRNGTTKTRFDIIMKLQNIE